MGFGGNMYTAVLALVFLCVFLSVGALFFTLWEVGQCSLRIKGAVTRDDSTIQRSRVILFLLISPNLKDTKIWRQTKNKSANQRGKI
jgi:hypothetical protein